MSNQQQFWEKMRRKYEKRNRILAQKQLELRFKLEAMDVIIGDGKKYTEREYIITPAPEPAPEPAPKPQLKVCSCKKKDGGGFFSYLISLLSFLFRRKAAPDAPPAVEPQEIPSKIEKEQSIKEDVTPTPQNVAVPETTDYDYSCNKTKRPSEEVEVLLETTNVESWCKEYEQEEDGGSCHCSFCLNESASETQKSGSSVCVCNLEK